MEMDKNSIIGLVLIFLILIGYAWYNQPSDAEIQAMKQRQDSIALAQKTADSLYMVQHQVDSIKATVYDSSAARTQFGTFASFTNGNEQFTTIENAELKLVFTNKGGRLYSIDRKSVV